MGNIYIKVMGCSSTKEANDPPPIVDPAPPTQTVDPRLPFTTYRQVYLLKASWKAVIRALDETAKNSLSRFFKTNPQFQNLFNKFNSHDITDEYKMYEDETFEQHAMAIATIFEQVVENLENVDKAIAILNKAGARHAKMEGFNPEYFKFMEEAFMAACHETLGDRFTTNTEQNFEKLFDFVHKHLEEGYKLGSAG